MLTCSLYAPHLDNTLRKGVKRTWNDSLEEDRQSDQIVPHFLIEKKARTEFPFSNMMRSMAAKYQPQTPVSSPSSTTSLLSLLSPLNNPYSRLMAVMADLSKQSNISSPTSSPSSTSTSSSPSSPSSNISQPLDLSTQEKEEDIDVVSSDEDDLTTVTELDQLSPTQVRDLVQHIPGCEDYAVLFESEKISGSILSNLTVYNLIQLLGVPMGLSVKIISRVKEIQTKESLDL